MILNISMFIRIIIVDITFFLQVYRLVATMVNPIIQEHCFYFQCPVSSY